MDALDRVGDGFAFVDREWRVTYANDAAGRLVGVLPEDTVGRRLWELFPDAVGTRFHRELHTAMEDRVEVCFESVYELRGVVLEVVAYPTGAGISVVIRDITERKRSQEELDRAKQLLEAHIQNSPLAVVEFDSEFRVTRWSDEAVRIFGYSTEEILGKRIFEMRWVYEEDVPLVEAESARLADGRASRSKNLNRNYRKDGSVIWCEWYSSAIYDDAGRITSVLSQVLDITERRQADQALRASLARTTALMEREEALKQVAEVSSASLRPGELASRICETVAQLFEAKQAQIRVVNERGTMLESVGVSDPTGVLQAIGDMAVDADTETAACFRGAEPRIGEDLLPTVSEPSRRNAAAAGVRSYVLLPIIMNDKPIGTLYMAWAEPHTFSPEDISFMRTITSQFTVGMSNARIFEAQSRRRRRIEALHDVLEVAVSSLDTGVMAQSILGHLANHYELELSSIWLENGGELELVAHSGYPQQYAALSPMPPSAAYDVAKVFRTQSPLVSAGPANPTMGDAYAKMELEVGSSVVVPLIGRDQAIGVLSLVWTTPQEIDEADIDFYESVAAEIAVAIENARLYAIEQERARLGSALAKIDSRLHESLDWETIARRAVAEGAEALGADSGALSLYQDGNFVVQFASGFDEDIVGRVTPEAQEQHSLLALSTRRPVVIDDVLTDPRVDAQLLASYGIGAMIVVPLVVGGRGLGDLYYNFAQARRFGDEEVRFARRLGTSLSLALDNARLFEAENAEARIAQALARIDLSVHSTLERDEMLRRVAQESAEAIGADSTLLALREGNEWVVRYSYNIPEDTIGRVFRIEDAPFVGVAANSRQPVAIDDVSADPRAKPELQGSLGVKAVMMAPLVERGEVFGGLFFNYRSVHRFTAQDVRYASRLASSVGLAIANIRLYETEHDIAERLQETLVALPDSLPGIAYSQAYRSATSQTGRVGGDFVDVFDAGRRLAGIAIGDVAGKGVEAAVITSLVRNTVRAHAIDGLSPHEVCAKTNRVMRRFTNLETYVTMFFGLMNTRTGSLAYASAGHPPALIIGNGMPPEELASASPILGAFDDAPFKDAAIMLRQGQRLVLYTDGVTEARSPAGADFLGIDGLKRALEAHTGETTSGLAGALMGSVVRFSAGVLRDDAAILVVEPTRLRHRKTGGIGIDR